MRVALILSGAMRVALIERAKIMMSAWVNGNGGYASCKSVCLAGERGTDGGGKESWWAEKKCWAGSSVRSGSPLDLIR